MQESTIWLARVGRLSDVKKNLEGIYSATQTRSLLARAKADDEETIFAALSEGSGEEKKRC